MIYIFTPSHFFRFAVNTNSEAKVNKVYKVMERPGVVSLSYLSWLCRTTKLAKKCTKQTRKESSVGLSVHKNKPSLSIVMSIVRRFEYTEAYTWQHRLLSATYSGYTVSRPVESDSFSAEVFRNMAIHRLSLHTCTLTWRPDSRRPFSICVLVLRWLL
jgi:hypothetical protein